MPSIVAASELVAVRLVQGKQRIYDALGLRLRKPYARDIAVEQMRARGAPPEVGWMIFLARRKCEMLYLGGCGSISGK